MYRLSGNIKTVHGINPTSKSDISDLTVSGKTFQYRFRQKRAFILSAQKPHIRFSLGRYSLNDAPKPHPYGSRLGEGNKKSVLLANISQLLPASATVGKDALSTTYQTTELSEDSQHLKGESLTKQFLLVALFRMISDDNALVKVDVVEVEDGRRRG